MAAPIYFAVLGQGLRLAVSFVLNFAVWWWVATAIYQEIPDSNPWLTAMSVRGA